MFRASGCCRKRNGDGILGVFVCEVNSHVLVMASVVLNGIEKVRYETGRQPA